MEGAALQARLAAALAPLRFAARNDFAHLERVRELEPTLARALNALAADGEVPGALTLCQRLPAPGTPRARRVERLREVLQVLEGWQAHGPQHFAAPGVTTKPSGQSTPRATAQPAGQAAPHPTIRPAGQPPSQATSQTVGQSPPRATNQMVGQAARRATTQTVGQAAPQATTQTVGQAAPRATSQPIGQAGSRATSQSVGQAAPQATSQPGDQATPRAGNKSVGQAKSRTTAEPSGQARASARSASQAKQLVVSAPAPDAGQGEVVLGLDQPLQYVRGIGPRSAQALEGRGLRTVRDVLHFFPRRYQGQHNQQAIAELQPDTVVSIEGQISRVADKFVRGRHSLEVVLTDATGSLHLVWFRVPGRAFASQFRRGGRIKAAGTVKRFRQTLQLVHPEVRHLDSLASEGPDEGFALGGPTGSGARDGGGAAFSGGAHAPAGHDPLGAQDAIVPLYLEVEGLHAGQLRRIVDAVLPSLVHLRDPLPLELRRARNLVALPEALRALHRPDPATPLHDLEAQATPAQQRLIYDECFYLQLGLLLRRNAQAQEEGVAVRLSTSLAALAQALLPFSLTHAQARALDDVAHDLARARPMQRLVQGDVGSGKTAVALVAAAAVARAGLQAALMAPTELLAEQHARTAHALLAPHGINVVLHTGQQAAGERRTRLAHIASGEAQLVIGTHALIQSDVQFARLGLAIVDEQHRFGVMQRARLAQMGQAGHGKIPHLLVMTATPIPRTLALTAYGDLDLSLIDALPPGRTPVATKLYADGQRAEVYAKVRDQVAEGRQAYVVFPLVEASDKEGMAELRAAVEQVQELQEGVLKGLRLGLLHGRLTREEKDAVMRAFVRRDVDVLVATTVVEVGIDVPNATVMVVEHAERFGLSQLHQLRGRVGRGAAQSSCLLLARFRPSETAWRRLGIMEQTNDGFRVAEEDLAIRGPGDFLGTRQSGVPILSMTNLARDGALLAQARQDAERMLERDPELTAPAHRAVRDELTGLWQGRLQLARLS